jgi:hypothetical protein
VPCYLFTYHAYGSWMPDHWRGYVKRKRGILPPDRDMAMQYRDNMVHDVVKFDGAAQRSLVDEAVAACSYQQLMCHFIATELTHAHLLVSWKTDRAWEIVRRKLRESLTRRLNHDICRQKWFSKSPSRKRVRDRKHFDYLMTRYLPRHSGLKWCEGRGLYQ